MSLNDFPSPTTIGKTKHGKTTTSKADKPLSLIADPKTWEEWENNAKYYEEQLKKCNEADTERLASLRKSAPRCGNTPTS